MKENIEKLYSGYDYLIMDQGPVSRLGDDELKELKRADYKIMICRADDGYLSALANFIRTLKEQADDWYFVFNTLTKSREKEVEKLMVGYNCFFLPVYEVDDVPQSVLKTVFERIY